MWRLRQTLKVAMKIAGILEQGHGICNREVHTISKKLHSATEPPCEGQNIQPWDAKGPCDKNRPTGGTHMQSTGH